MKNKRAEQLNKWLYFTKIHDVVLKELEESLQLLRLCIGYEILDYSI